jgi:hypothetical protein
MDSDVLNAIKEKLEMASVIISCGNNESKICFLESSINKLSNMASYYDQQGGEVFSFAMKEVFPKIENIKLKIQYAIDNSYFENISSYIYHTLRIYLCFCSWNGLEWHHIASFNLSVSDKVRLTATDISIDDDARIDWWVDQLWKGVSYRSKSINGLHPDLKRSDIKDMWKNQRGVCSLTAIPFRECLYKGEKVMICPLQPSIDRINSSMPYTKANSQVTVLAANYAKNKFGIDNVIGFMLESVRNYSKLTGISADELLRMDDPFIPFTLGDRL